MMSDFIFRFESLHGRLKKNPRFIMFCLYLHSTSCLYLDQEQFFATLNFVLKNIRLASLKTMKVSTVKPKFVRKSKWFNKSYYLWSFVSHKNNWQDTFRDIIYSLILKIYLWLLSSFTSWDAQKNSSDAIWSYLLNLKTISNDKKSLIS